MHTQPKPKRTAPHTQPHQTHFEAWTLQHKEDTRSLTCLPLQASPFPQLLCCCATPCQTPKTTHHAHIITLAGDNRPALAKSHSFQAKLAYLGSNLLNTSDALEAALERNSSAGKKELDAQVGRTAVLPWPRMA